MDDITQARYYTSRSHESDLVALRRKLHDFREIIPDDQRLLDEFTLDVGINLNKTV